MRVTNPDLTNVTGGIGYSYDSLQHLTQVRYPATIGSGSTVNYTYDPVGNRLTKTGMGPSITYTYDTQNNELDSANTTNNRTGYGYDSNGNQISKSGGYTYGWDFENRLLKTKRSSPLDSTLFSYDGNGTRFRKVGTQDTLAYVHDGMYAVVECGGSGALKAKYVYVNGLLCAMLKATGEKYYFHHDGLASSIGVIGTTNGQSAVVQSYIYDEFGNMLIATGSLDNHYLYTGQEWDPAPASLYNLRARMYDPTIGRFLSEDPIAGTKGAGVYDQDRCSRIGCGGGRATRIPVQNPQDLNQYVYVANNPINWTDPLGLSRYKGCEGERNPIRRWLCRKAVDYACGRLGAEAECCRQDQINCLAEIRWDCDPHAEEKAKDCYAKYLRCLAKAGQ